MQNRTYALVCKKKNGLVSHAEYTRYKESVKKTHGRLHPVHVRCGYAKTDGTTITRPGGTYRIRDVRRTATTRQLFFVSAKTSVRHMRARVNVRVPVSVHAYRLTLSFLHDPDTSSRLVVFFRRKPTQTPNPCALSALATRPVDPMAGLRYENGHSPPKF